MFRALSILALVVTSLLTACGGGIPGSADIVGGSGTGIFGPGGDGGVNDGSNPATRPTPGFTEVTVNPATSVSEAQTEKFSRIHSVKFLGLNLGGVELDEVRMVIENLNFDDNISPGIEGPGYVILRLIQNGVIVDDTVPFLGSAILPEGIYHTLDFNFRILQAGDVPPEGENDPVITQYLVGHSIVIEGSYLYDLPLLGNLLRIPFRFFSDQTSTIRIEDNDGLPFFGQDETHFLFIVSKVQLWFDVTVVNLLQSLSLTVLPVVGGVVNGILDLDVNSVVTSISQVAITIQENIDTAFRFGLGPDIAFAESDVLEASFSFQLLP